MDADPKIFAADERIDKAVILLSGGADSATLLAYMSSVLKIGEIHALSFVYGQKHAREIEMAAWQAATWGVLRHRIYDISFMGEVTAGKSALTGDGLAVPDLKDLDESSRSQPATYVPNRNMIFVSIAAAYAESHGMGGVFYGAQAQDEYGYWDCTVDFVEKMNNLFALNRTRGQAIRLHAPFAGVRKAEIIALGRRLGVDYTRTWTCYRGGHEPCGTCPSCMEREKAFTDADNIAGNAFQGVL